MAFSGFQCSVSFLHQISYKAQFSLVLPFVYLFTRSRVSLTLSTNTQRQKEIDTWILILLSESCGFLICLYHFYHVLGVSFTHNR